MRNNNIKKHKVTNIRSIKSNWFDSFKEKDFFDLILTNPPYIAKDDNHLTNPEINYEPSNALVAADNGFSDIFKIIDNSPKFLNLKGMLIIEHGYTQANKVKDYLQKKLREHFIETNQVHFRNDRYSIFKKFVKGKKFPNMDYLENKYLVLPVHHKVTVNDAKYISKLINKYAK